MSPVEKKKLNGELNERLMTGGFLCKRAPLIGGIAMDALMVDITDIPEAQMWDEAVIMGKQGGEEITVRDIAKLKNSVTYDVLTNWRLRLRRKSVNGREKAARQVGVAELC